MIPESEIVKVSISTSQAAVSQTGFGLVCALGTSTALPSGRRYGIYSSLAEVASDFPNNTPEYAFAQQFFSLSPQPDELMIARMFNAPIPAELLGGANPTVALATFQAIANGALSINIDGTPENIVGINLSGAQTLVQVANDIQAAIDAVKAGVTVTWTGTEFIVRSGTTGAGSTLGFATAAPAGTDLAPLLALRQADGSVLTQGAIAESVTQSIQAVLNLNPFYMFALTDSPSDADIQAAAAFALANGMIYGYTSPEAGALQQGSNTDIFAILKGTSNGRAIGVFDLVGANPHLIAGALAQAATVDFTGTDTTETLAFKVLPGATTSNLSLTQKTVLDGKNANYYISVGGNPLFYPGKMADGTWFDQVQGLDWLQQTLQAAAFQAEYGSKKLPQSDRGVATVMHLLEPVLQQAVNNGLIAPGVWNGAPVGQLKTGQTLQKGYYMFASSVNSQTQQVRNTRVAPPIQIVVKGAGAIQGLNILINFQQ